MNTKIFLDSGDPKETKAIIEALGYLDGQTTNPSLIVKNPEAQSRLALGNKFSKEEVWSFYEQVVKDISIQIPNGSVSIEVYADASTKAEEMLEQAQKFNKWIPNAHIKYPTTLEGLKAAQMSIKDGMKVNMTLVFSQEQAAAVYAATKGAKRGDVFLSPFIGRLDDKGEEGMDLIKNIVQMFKAGDGHVEVLAASVRNERHFIKSIELGADIITAPMSAILEWNKGGRPEHLKTSETRTLKEIPYQEIDLEKNFTEYNISHELTDKGLEKFASDWNSIIA